MWEDSKPGYVQISTDGGNTFPTTIALPAGAEAYSIANDPNTNTLYLGSNQGVLASSSGGAFVQTNMNFSPAYQVIVDSSTNPSTEYAGVAYYGVISSTDGFNQQVNFPLNLYFGNAQALDLDRTTTPATLYTGTSQGVYKSSDGGKTFVNSGLANDNPPITSIAIDPGSPLGIFASLYMDTTATISEISSDGSQLLFSSLFGGSEAGFALGLNVSSSGSIYLAGGTYAHDFPTTMGAYQQTSTAQLSGFAANISQTSTPSGSNQTVAPNGGTSLTFSNVSSPGTTSATTSDTNPNPPSGYNPVSQYSDIMTTASYSGAITVCLNYNPGQVFDASQLTLLHFEVSGWVNVTTSNDTQQGIICGNVTSLSPFVIALPLVEERLEISPRSLAFGNKVVVGTTSKAKTVTIKNAGKKKTGLAVSVGTENALPPSVYAVKSQCDQTLLPGRSCKVAVTFTPPDTTEQTGHLMILDNVVGTPQSVALSGTGKAPREKK